MDEVLVDPEDQWLLDAHRWCIANINGWRYVMTKIDGKTAYLHRLIMGVTDRRLFVDHRNHNGLDNRRSNLRVATNSQNQWNRNGGSGSIGRHKGRWRWRLRVGDRRLEGYAATQREATIKLNAAIEEHLGEYGVKRPVPHVRWRRVGLSNDS